MPQPSREHTRQNTTTNSDEPAQPTLFSAEEPVADVPSSALPHLSPTQLSPGAANPNMPVIEVTAQLVDALERGDPQAKVYVEKQ